MGITAFAQARPENDFSDFDVDELNNQPTFDVSIGLNTYISRSDYFSNCPIGIAAALAGGVNRHVWGMEVSFAFGGEFNKDLHTHKGWILKDDNLCAGHAAITYGYSMGSKPGYKLQPFVGIGASFFEGPQIGHDEEGNREYLEKAGFLLEGGVIIDIPVKRTFENDGFSRSAFYRSIRLKPTIGLNYVADGPGWFPSFNFAVLFDWRGIGY